MVSSILWKQPKPQLRSNKALTAIGDDFFKFHDKIAYSESKHGSKSNREIQEQSRWRGERRCTELSSREANASMLYRAPETSRRRERRRRGSILPPKKNLSPPPEVYTASPRRLQSPFSSDVEEEEDDPSFFQLIDDISKNMRGK